MIISNYLPCDMRLNPFPFKKVTNLILFIFSEIKQTNFCCNEIYVSNNSNTTFIPITRDFLQKCRVGGPLSRNFFPSLGSTINVFIYFLYFHLNIHLPATQKMSRRYT